MKIAWGMLAMWHLIQTITVNISGSTARARRYAAAAGVGVASGLFFYAIARVVITLAMWLVNHVVK